MNIEYILNNTIGINVIIPFQSVALFNGNDREYTYADLNGIHVISFVGSILPGLLHNITHNGKIFVLLQPHVGNQDELANHQQEEQYGVLKNQEYICK